MSDSNLKENLKNVESFFKIRVLEKTLEEKIEDLVMVNKKIMEEIDKLIGKIDQKNLCNGGI